MNFLNAQDKNDDSTIKYELIDISGTPIGEKVVHHPEDYAFLKTVNIYRIRHFSDGHWLTGFMAKPKSEGNYPCVVYNRGGNRDLGELLVYHAVEVLAKIAANGYVLIASNYRGNGGGEGQEEFGGADVNDVVNLISSLQEIPYANYKKVALLGVSRGAMMNYLVLKRNPENIKATVQIGGISDLEETIKYHKKIEKVIKDLIPNYKSDRDKEVWNRSVINWVEQLPKKIPHLILHSKTDKHVAYSQTGPLLDSLKNHAVPYKMVSFENDNHGILNHQKEVTELIEEWLEMHLKKEQSYSGFDHILIE